MAEKPRGGSTGDGLGQGPPSSSLAEGPSTVLHPHPQFSSPAQSCPTLCEPMDCSTPGFPVHHQLPELAETHVHQVGDAMQPSHPVIPFSSHLQSFPTSGSFLMSQLFASGGQSIGAAASASGSSPALLVSATCWRASLLPPCLLPGLAQAALLALS